MIQNMYEDSILKLSMIKEFAVRQLDRLLWAGLAV